MTEPLLRTEDVTKRFGSFTAVDNVSLSVAGQEFRAIIGPNGAGKTTLFNLITGLLTPTHGELFFKGDCITDLSEERRAQLGMAKSYQINSLFPELTIRQNIRLGVQRAQGHNWNFWNRVESKQELEDGVRDIAYFVKLEKSLETQVSNLSHGEKRKLELAVALSVEPDLLLLDEPAAGLGQDETKNLITILDAINEDVPIVLVEHDVDLVMEVSDTITVLARGEVVAEGSPGYIAEHEQVQQVYLEGGVA
jgi:branched-chain amino acid transport system ATP-binding protein